MTIGGIAIQAYGGQHQALGLDVAIAASTDNLARLASALLDLDARILGPDGQRSPFATGRPQDLADVRLLESLDDAP